MPTMTGKVFKYLEDLQEPYYGASWVQQSPETPEAMGAPKPPTKYEHPTTYSIMVRAGEAIESAASRRDIAIPILPALGTLPTGRVNAMAALADADYLVLFHDNLFTFALLLSKLVAASIPTTVEDGFLKFDTMRTDKHLAANPFLVDRFKNFLYSYVVRGSVAGAEPYVLKDPYARTASWLRDSMEFFVMGHEYAHIIKGHLSGPRKRVRVRGGTSLEEISRSYEQEFEADALGLQLAISAMESTCKTNLVWSYGGVDLFFSTCSIVENATRVLLTGESGALGSDTHPDAETRRTALRSRLPQLLPEFSLEDVNAAAAVGDYVNRIMSHFWAHTERRMRALHQIDQWTRTND